MFSSGCTGSQVPGSTWRPGRRGVLALRLGEVGLIVPICSRQLMQAINGRGKHTACHLHMARRPCCRHCCRCFVHCYLGTEEGPAASIELVSIQS